MTTFNYKEEIGKLKELQKIDSQIFGLNKERSSKPSIIKDMETQFETKKQVLKESDEKFKKVGLKRKEIEGNLAAKEEQIKQLQAKLYSLKTNKEYSTMLSQIQGAQMDKSLVEEDILKSFDEQEEVNKEKLKLEQDLKVQEGEFQQEKQKILNRLKELDAQIADLESKRQVALHGIDKNILTQYERILRGKEGLAIVEAAHNSCQGCYMNIPHQVINEIKMYNKLVFCEMCSRILFVEDDDKS